MFLRGLGSVVDIQSPDGAPKRIQVFIPGLLQRIQVGSFSVLRSIILSAFLPTRPRLGVGAH